MTETLFVYGLLLKGLEGHERLDPERCRFAGEATIEGRLYDLGPYPALRTGEPGTVHGELYEILDPALVCELDVYEGYHGRSETCRYLRRMVSVTVGNEVRQAWVYEYNPRRNMMGAVPVESGDYRQARREVGKE